MVFAHQKKINDFFTFNAWENIFAKKVIYAASKKKEKDVSLLLSTSQ